MFPVCKLSSSRGSPAGNPLLVFSSLLYWGEDGRYSPERVLAEELESQDGSGKEATHRNDMETVLIDKNLVRLAVSAVAMTGARRRSRKIILGNMRGRNIRPSKVSVIEHVLNSVRHTLLIPPWSLQCEQNHPIVTHTGFP